jgi:hypothetical protein
VRCKENHDERAATRECVKTIFHFKKEKKENLPLRCAAKQNFHWDEIQKIHNFLKFHHI